MFVTWIDFSIFEMNSKMTEAVRVALRGYANERAVLWLIVKPHAIFTKILTRLYKISESPQIPKISKNLKFFKFQIFLQSENDGHDRNPAQNTNRK